MVKRDCDTPQQLSSRLNTVGQSSLSRLTLFDCEVCARSPLPLSLAGSASASPSDKMGQNRSRPPIRFTAWDSFAIFHHTLLSMAREDLATFCSSDFPVASATEGAVTMALRFLVGLQGMCDSFDAPSPYLTWLSTFNLIPSPWNESVRSLLLTYSFAITLITKLGYPFCIRMTQTYGGFQTSG